MMMIALFSANLIKIQYFLWVYSAHIVMDSMYVCSYYEQCINAVWYLNTDILQLLKNMVIQSKTYHNTLCTPMSDKYGTSRDELHSSVASDRRDLISTYLCGLSEMIYGHCTGLRVLISVHAQSDVDWIRSSCLWHMTSTETGFSTELLA